MLGTTPFIPENLKYTGYRQPKTFKTMDYVLGFDTESTTSGKLLCAVNHQGKSYDVNDLPNSILKGNHYPINFMTWNAKHEQGFFFKSLPEDKAKELRLSCKCEHNGITYQLKGNTSFSISKGNCRAYFWDLMPFYKLSLAKAASIYLNSTKAYIDYNSLTDSFKPENLPELTRCCQQHAYLTYKLWKVLELELKAMNIQTNKLYSTASIASRAFHKNCHWTDLTFPYKFKLDFITAFQKAYAGGMNLVTQRGTAQMYLYDVVSMYPSQMVNLKDLSGAIYLKSNEYQANVSYGALLCRIDITDVKTQPVGLLHGMVRYYPQGLFYAWITKQEYDFLVECGYKVDILEGYWVKANSKHYPFRAYIKKLITLKSQYKQEGGMRYNLVKLILNSMYGKTIQLHPDLNGNIYAGVDYNPIYASYITACARVKMCEIARKVDANVLAIHTDSLITDKPLPEDMLSKELGGLAYEFEGQGLLIAPGVYEISNKVKTRSFKPWSLTFPTFEGEKFTFRRLLQTNPKASKYTIRYNQMLSWKLGFIRHDVDRINSFIEETKIIDLNAYTKRVWLEKATGERLLNGLQESIPLCELQMSNQKQVIRRLGVKCEPKYHYLNKSSTNKVKKQNWKGKEV